MSLAATLIYALEPPTTLVTVFVGFVVIYWFARWASGHRSGGGELEPPLKELAAPEPVYVDPEYVGKSGEGFVTRKFYFDNFDPVPGPPDPENFCDELTVEVYVLDTGALWSDTYTVASSAGIRAYMDSHGWKVFYTEKIFVFRRYELALIRSAVNDHIKEILDEVKNGANSTSAAQ